jgi:hypothetical protein
MKSLTKILRFCKQRIKTLIVNCLTYIPFASKYIGPPKGYYISAKEYWKIFEISIPHNVTYKTYLPQSLSKRNLPQSIYGEIHWKFNGRYLHNNPETFVLSISNGRVFSGNGTIISHDDRLILDISLQFGIGTDERKARSHNVFQHFKLPNCQETDQTIAVLATAGGEGYFHWLTDALPRLEIIRKTLPEGLVGIDKFVVNKGIPIINETLKLLGIPPDNLIFANSHLHIQAKNLIVPSLPGSTGDPPDWVIAFLRETFLKNKASISLRTKLYISRSKANYRKVTNEEDVLECLSTFGFTPIWLEEHDLATQVALFANAEFIIAPHGAGLTNLIWCNPSTKVLEIFSPNYVNVCFWAIANQVGMEYFYLIGDGEKPPEHIDPHLVGDNINVPLEELHRSLDILLK